MLVLVEAKYGWCLVVARLLGFAQYAPAGRGHGPPDKHDHADFATVASHKNAALDKSDNARLKPKRNMPLKHKMGRVAVALVSVLSDAVADVAWEARSQPYEPREQGLHDSVDMIFHVMAGLDRAVKDGETSIAEAKSRAAATDDLW